MALPFTKMQAVGNDFVTVAASNFPDPTDWAALAARLCDRKFGVGADGLLVVGRSDAADVRMRMFNPDGTEDMCGNGLRCVIRFARDTGILSSDTGTAETLAGVLDFTINPDNGITTQMGRPALAPAALPMLSGGDGPILDYPILLGGWGEVVYVSAISTGTPHTVLWTDAPPDDERFLRVSPIIEQHPLFPARTSVLWATVESEDRINLRIWERGAGETLGCGTGACAAAALAMLEGRASEPEVAVVSKGGVLQVRWTGEEADSIYLTGPAHTVYSGEFDHAEG